MNGMVKSKSDKRYTRDRRHLGVLPNGMKGRVRRTGDELRKRCSLPLKESACSIQPGNGISEQCAKEATGFNLGLRVNVSIQPTILTSSWTCALKRCLLSAFALLVFQTIIAGDVLKFLLTMLKLCWPCNRIGKGL